jgi:hypothetical protein
VRRRSSGESSGPSALGRFGPRRGPGEPLPRSGAVPSRPPPTVVGRSASGRRITRPANLDDSGALPHTTTRAPPGATALPLSANLGAASDQSILGALSAVS